MFDNIITQHLIGQSFGIIAMIIAFYGLVQKNDNKALKVIIVSSCFWALHFVFMGVYSAFAVTIIGIFRIFLSLKYKRNKRIFLAIISATLIFGIITYENTYSLIPIIGSCISAYGYFFFERIRLRFFMFTTSLFWFTFHLSTGSIGGIVNEVVVQTILIVAMYKMIHEEGKRVFFVDRVMDIIKTPHPDVGRFINIYDFIDLSKVSLKKRIFNKYKSFKLNIKNKIVRLKR